MGIWYATREEVKSALDSAETARNNTQIDGAIESASRSVENLTHRRFYPELATRYFDWPNSSFARAGRLWLESNELASVTSFVSGGVTIPSTDYFLRRSDELDEPPYTYLEIDRSSSAALGSGGTAQRSNAITGVYIGCRIDEALAGTLAEALDDSETGIDIATANLVGVGSILRVDSERMVVISKSNITTAQTVLTPLTANNSNVSVSVTNGALFAIGEVLTIDSERMLIVDIAGNTLTVKRGWDGSVLATHSGSTIYAARSLTVTRGVLGTTAATHSTFAPFYRFDPPGPVNELTVAESMNTMLQKGSGYARIVGSGDAQREASGRALAELRRTVKLGYGRNMRIGAI